MTALLHILLALLAVATPAKPVLHAMSVPRAPLAVGRSYQYKQGVFLAVARNRGMALDWSASGFASVPNCQYVDAARPWYVLATIAGEPLRLQIIDCSQARDLAHQRRMGLIIEVNYDLAARQGWDAYGDDGPGWAPATIWRYER